MSQESTTPATLIGVIIGAFALVIVAILYEGPLEIPHANMLTCARIFLIQVRRRASRPASASTETKETTEKRAHGEMLQQLESLCPTKSCEEWLENAQVEQDLSDRDSSDIICSMCLDDVRKSDMMHVLSCRHVYHAACLEQWFLGNHFQCPLCNRAFFQQTEAGPENV
ncbi:RING finger protein [Aspergillus clavatus NRRL 1]|uniref:RING finger domain protein n=1 Tax=Aspergillus clavatus (strain ATCC 1007 / CBS 513.65 / DSM 816 / NCTC 3887 / NRRL 1 / QM 1276 / 107) TaxID=344612 RepID=A1CC23_ASPCL|nr:RING finger domain protein [Aspergillus clavatus NRRL 1]EAW13291.1 RING finger domain protein [Aspergillus clavatus NRRL 1]